MQVPNIYVVLHVRDLPAGQVEVPVSVTHALMQFFSNDSTLTLKSTQYMYQYMIFYFQTKIYISCAYITFVCTLIHIVHVT